MRTLGRSIFEQEGWRVSIQQLDRLGRMEHIYIFRELSDHRIELYRHRPDEGGGFTKIIDETEAASEPDAEFAIIVPAGFGTAVAAVAEPGPSKVTMDEVRDRLKVADARVDRFIDFALTGKLA